ncbi:MAG: hypothetical protein AAGJ34_01320 [Pseudomonadota bacterium]
MKIEIDEYGELSKSELAELQEYLDFRERKVGTSLLVAAVFPLFIYWMSWILSKFWGGLFFGDRLLSWTIPFFVRHKYEELKLTEGATYASAAFSPLALMCIISIPFFVWTISLLISLETKFSIRAAYGFYSAVSENSSYTKEREQLGVTILVLLVFYVSCLISVANRPVIEIESLDPLRAFGRKGFLLSVHMMLFFTNLFTGIFCVATIRHLRPIKTARLTGADNERLRALRNNGLNGL